MPKTSTTVRAKRPAASKTVRKPQTRKASTKTSTAKRKSSSAKSGFVFNKLHFALFIVAFALIGAGVLVYAQAATNTLTFYLGFGNGKNAALAFAYGNPGDIPVGCKLGGKTGSTTVSVFRPSEGKFYLHGSNDSTPGATVVAFGSAESQPLCGDWDGNGSYTIGAFTPSTHTFNLRNSNTAGAPDRSVSYGLNGDVALACDWDGDGKTDIGVYRPSDQRFYLQWKTAGVDANFMFGNPQDIPICGNWDGKGGAGVGIYRPSNSTFYLSDSVTAPSVTYIIPYGNAGDKPLAGDWQALGHDSPGVYRLGPVPTAPSNSGVVDFSQKNTYKAPAPAAPAPSAAAPSAAPAAPAPSVAAAAAAASAGPSTGPALQMGATGAAVSQLQQRLAALGYWIRVDGDFGPGTRAAVVAFQQSHGLAADGIVGPQTYAALNSVESTGTFSPPPIQQSAVGAALIAAGAVMNQRSNQALAQAAQVAAAFAAARQIQQVAAAQAALQQAARVAAAQKAVQDAAAVAAAQQAAQAAVVAAATQSITFAIRNFR